MKENFKFNEKGPRSAAEILKELGFSDITANVVQVASRLGARKVLELHGASEDDLKTVFKAEAGMTPVTEADKHSGEAMKWFISHRLPGDAINEEETGFSAGSNRRQWEVDPLDGTSSFGREQRYSTVGACVYEKDEPVAASICHPFEKELLVAQKNKGAFLFNLDEKMAILGEPIKIEVSDKGLENGVVYLDALFNNKTAPVKLKLIEKLVQQAGGKLGIRMTGSNIDQERQIACGRGEATITDAVGGFWDLAAGSLIIKEAGGEFCDQNGEPVNKDTQVAIGGSKKVVKQLLPILQECYKDYKGFK